MADITVTGLALTAVKAMRFTPVDCIELGDRGAVGDRSFYVVDERDEMINGKRLGRLQTIIPAYDRGAGELTLTFPDGQEVSGPISYGETLTTRFFGRPRPARELRGPWSEALSEFLGCRLRLVEKENGNAVDRGRRAAVSLVSRESLERLAGAADTESIDGRRFRMLVEIGGVAAHEEDRWVGRRVRIGPALVRMNGHVGRCMVTTRNPDSGTVDLRTLHALAAYRQDEESSEPLPFGVYGEVLRGGVVRLGDPVAAEAE